MMAAAEFIVDVHHHYMPAVLFDRLAAQAGGKRIVTNEISLTLNPSRKDLEAHLKTMDESGVAVSILTDQVQVMGADVAKALNDGIAEVEKKHPTRFRGAIHLPIHEPEAAKRELERGINELGLRAVALLACHLDVQLDNPIMNPLFEVIQKNNLPIIIHPQSKPTGSETTYNLDRCVFRPLETTQAIVRVMCSVLPRYPELRFIMPHLGGATSSLKGRMMAFFETADADIPADMRGYLKTQAEQKKFGLTERFEKLFQSLYFDTRRHRRVAAGDGCSAQHHHRRSHHVRQRLSAGVQNRGKYRRVPGHDSSGPLLGNGQDCDSRQNRCRLV